MKPVIGKQQVGSPFAAETSPNWCHALFPRTKEWFPGEPFLSCLMLFPWVLWAHRKLQGICTVNSYFHDLAPQIRFPKEELQAQYPVHRQDHTQTAESQLLLSSNGWGDPAAAQQLMERGKSGMCTASSGTENPLVPSNV